MLYKIKDLVINKGLLRGPFGGALKKEIFVEKGADTYKVYEQGCVLNKDHIIGNYYITKEYFNSKMKNFEALPGDILVSCSGVNYGAIYKLPEEIEKGIINQALLRIRVNKNIINDDYFCYIFQFLISNIITASSGDSTIPNFPPLNTIKEIEVDIPPLSEQEKIVTFLNSIRNKIECNNNIIKSLTNKIKEAYSFYVKSCDDTGQKYVINELLSFKKGIEPIKTETGNLIKYYRVRDIDSDTFSLIKDNQNLLIAKYGDVIYSLDGTIGKISYSIEGAISSGLYIVSSSYTKYPILYYCIMDDEEIKLKLQYGSRSNTIIKHASSLLKNIEYKINLEIAEKFAIEYTPLFDKCIMLSKENLVLKNIKEHMAKLLLSKNAIIN